MIPAFRMGVSCVSERENEAPLPIPAIGEDAWLAAPVKVPDKEGIGVAVNEAVCVAPLQEAVFWEWDG